MEKVSSLKKPNPWPKDSTYVIPSASHRWIQSQPEKINTPKQYDMKRERSKENSL